MRRNGRLLEHGLDDRLRTNGVDLCLVERADRLASLDEVVRAVLDDAVGRVEIGNTVVAGRDTTEHLAHAVGTHQLGAVHRSTLRRRERIGAGREVGRE